MVLELSPSEIRYSQNSMRSRFRNGNPIEETLRKLLSGKITVVDIPRIRVAEKDGKYYSMDNRRLYVFKRFEEKKGTKIKVKCIETGMDPGKFTTTNDGTSIRIKESRNSSDFNLGFWDSNMDIEDSNMGIEDGDLGIEDGDLGFEDGDLDFEFWDLSLGI